eukprot:s888_g1.t1
MVQWDDEEPFRTAVVIRRVLVPSKPRTDDRTETYEDPAALQSFERPTSPNVEEHPAFYSGSWETKLAGDAFLKEEPPT